MAIADRLKEARISAGLSQEQVSDRLHVSRQLVSKWESGASEPKASELVQCADIYGTTLDWLCGRAVSAPAAEPPMEAEGQPPEETQIQEAAPSAGETQPLEETQLPEEVQAPEEPQIQPEETQTPLEQPSEPEKPRKRQPSRKEFCVLLLLLAGTLIAVIVLAAKLRDSNRELWEQSNHLSINDPFSDYSLSVWDQNNLPWVTVDPEVIQTPPADQKTDTYETRRFDVTINPGAVYQLTDFLTLPPDTMVTFQAEYIPSIEFVCYGIMNRDLEATEILTHNEISGRVQVSKAGEYCLYIQNRSKEVIKVQGYYTYPAVDGSTPEIQR